MTTQPQQEKSQKQKPVRSLRLRLLFSTLGMVTLAVVVLATLAITTFIGINQVAQAGTRAELHRQAEDNLAALTAAHAHIYNETLASARRAVQSAAAETAAAFEPAGPFAGLALPPGAGELITGPQGQSSNGDDARTSVFLPASTSLSTEVRAEVERSAFLELILPTLLQSNPALAAGYFATPSDLVRYYPNIHLGAVLPPDFRASQRPWFTACTPQADPDHSPQWTTPYADATGRGLVATISAPVYSSQGRFLGVVGLDVTLDQIRARIEAFQPEGRGYSFLVGPDGQAIVLPDQGAQDLLGVASGEPGADLSASPTGFAGVIRQMAAGQEGMSVISTQGRELFVAYAPLEGAGWSLGSVVAAEDVLQGIQRLEKELAGLVQALMSRRAGPAILLVLAVLVLVDLWWTRRLVEPLRRLSAAAVRISQGDLSVRVPPLGRDEIGQLGHAFNDMAGELGSMVASLEQRVAERTAELERRTHRLQLSAQVGQQIASARSPEALAGETAEQVQARFGFYHAALFLLDPSGETAWLAAAAGEAAAAVRQRRQGIRAGDGSLEGDVLLHGQARALKGESRPAAAWADPLLSRARSAVILPLRAGERILGVLQVLSASPAAFDSQEVAILQTLADQAAVTLENLALVEKLSDALDESEYLTRRQSRQGWELAAGDLQDRAYAYDRLHVRPVLPSDLPPQAGDADLRRRLADGEVVLLPPGEGTGLLLAPVRIHTDLVGIIGLEKGSPGQAWSAEERHVAQAAADQAALNLENARLYAEIQSQSERQRRVAAIGDRMGSALDIDSLVQVTLQELQAALGAVSGEVHLGVEADLLAQLDGGCKPEPQPAPAD